MNDKVLLRPQVGDIWVVTNGNSNCLGLVVAERDSSVDLILLSNETEYICIKDVLLDRSTTGLRYELLAECELTSRCDIEQLSEWVGGVAPATAAGLVEAALLGDYSRIDPAMMPGTRVKGPKDPRWVWKESEFNRLLQFCPGWF